MLWRTSPAATELEEVSLGVAAPLLGLPDAFEGVIYDTASISSLHALAAAREAAVPTCANAGLAARADVGAVRIYCSEQAHSSIDKAVITLGLGLASLRRIPVDDDVPDARRRAARGDRRRPRAPASLPSPSSRRSARRRRRASIRCGDRGRSAARGASGCTSTRHTRASRRCCRSALAFRTAGTAPTRSSSTRTSGCSRRST